MLSEDTQNLLARILLSLAQGERKVEDARKEISYEDCYDIQAIFRKLDNNGDNRITPKDIQKYLLSNDLEVNFVEIKLLILFYDQDHDFALTYGEIFKMIHPGKEMPNVPKYKQDEELNVKVERKLYHLLEQEILMARSVLALLDEIKHKRDFNIHGAFHCLKYYACITGDSINVFLKNCGMNPTAGDIRAIVKRLDINKDNIIDFCEFHAFLGYPNCTFCCPCFPCSNCGAKYCQNCLQDIPCYLIGCDHIGMDSKMRCTSFEHNPGLEGATSILGSVRASNIASQSLYKTKMISRNNDNEEEEDDFHKSKYNGRNNQQFNTNGFNSTRSTNFNTPGRNGRGYNRGNISPEQFKLLQGLTNPDQLDKFMTISGILDRQNSQEINVTGNLSLRLCPLRDFDPRDWGCKNCPCNIHSNPNVSCDCCSCNVCPFKSKEQSSRGKQKQRIFPKVSLYSYSYSYEPDTSQTNISFLSSDYDKNNPIYINSPKRVKTIYDRELNKYKTVVSSSDDEKEYEDYMSKVGILRDTFGPAGKSKFPNYSNNIQNNMIYSDDVANNNKMINDQISRSRGQYAEDMNINNEEINEQEEENIRHKNITLKKMYKNETNNEEMRKKMERKKRRDNNEDDGENEDENDNQDNQGNQFQNLNKIQTFGRNDQNFDNNNPDNNMMSKTSPIIGNNPDNNIMPKTSPGINNNQDNNMMSKAYPNIGNNQDNNMLSKTTPNININDNEKRGSKDLFGSTTKTLYTINNNNKINLQGSRIPSKVEEESEEEITSKNLDIHKSYEEVMDDREKKFIKYLKEVIKSEREIEFARRDLMRQRDFNGEDAFRLFEVEGSGVVTKKDLNFGLKLLGINPTFYQIVLIFNRYDLDGNDFMEYQDFFDMVVSYKDEDRKEEEKRKSNRNIGNRRKELFSPRTRDLYKKLFLVIIEEEERLEKLRQKLNINDQMMNEIFYKINEDKDGICNKNEFANYCLRNNICKERKDAYLVFIRLNKNRDGGLESKEFSNELKSSVLGP